MKAKLTLFFLLITLLISAQTHYDVTSGNGNGFRFWNGSNSYKIHMGNSTEYKYGPVTDYSIKMNMTNTTGRGWTWGVAGLIPIAALNTNGDFQLARNLTVLGKQGIGTDMPGAKLHVVETTELGTNLGDYQILTQIQGKTSNKFKESTWVVRDAGGSDWVTARIHNAIGIDNSYLTPKVNTKTWWERDPYNNIQSWGNSSETYMSLISGKLGIGTTSPDSKLAIKDATNNQLSLTNTTGNSWQFRTGDTGSMIFKDDGVERLRIDASGNLGIGTSNPGTWKLAVMGKIRAEEIKVETGWADYVFKNDYKLPTLEEVEQHIKEKGHLINIPSEKEVAADGIELGEMNKLLLEKIEELTLYVIELNKELNHLKHNRNEN